jgi:hypothetical protein
MLLRFYGHFFWGHSCQNQIAINRFSGDDNRRPQKSSIKGDARNQRYPLPRPRNWKIPVHVPMKKVRSILSRKFPTVLSLASRGLKNLPEFILNKSHNSIAEFILNKSHNHVREFIPSKSHNHIP